MFTNMRKTGLCVNVEQKGRSSFQFPKLIHGALVFSLVFIVSSGSVWAVSNDFVDFSVLASYWRATDCALSADCNGMDSEPDGDLDEVDLADFSSNWLSLFFVVEDTLYSMGNQDGRTWDNGTVHFNGGANSSDGLAINVGTAIRLGDLDSFFQGFGYRSVLAFDMTELPSDAQITSARIELNRGGSSGQNPFTWADSNCVVDMNSPYFGTGSSLVTADWTAAAGASKVATLTENIIDPNIVESTLFNANGLNAFDINSIAQMKIYFEAITNEVGDTNDDYLGFHSGEYAADPNLRPRLIVQYLTAGVFTVELDSIAADDGRVYAQDPNVVGTGANNTDPLPSALRLGDYEETGDLYTQRTVVSFDTSTLPDDCTILSAKLQLIKSDTDGNDPFNWGGSCYIDVNSPSIGKTDALEKADWEAVSDANQVAEFVYLAAPANGSPMISEPFNTAGLNAISKTAKTQLKIYFDTQYLANGVEDGLDFYSGESGDAAKRPKLIVEYRIAVP